MARTFFPPTPCSPLLSPPTETQHSPQVNLAITHSLLINPLAPRLPVTSQGAKKRVACPQPHRPWKDQSEPNTQFSQL